jgi:hypothetical protein
MTPSRWPRLLAAAGGFAWFLWIGGAPVLNPLNVGWLQDGDWMQHWMGWLFFRIEPWTFPLGAISSIPYPIGTNVGFTDSNPLVSLLLKPFSSVLPSEFQFIGPWLALCFVLQGYTGAAVASVVTKNRLQQLLGGLLIVLSPVLLGRLGHDTLCAHWLLLGLLYVGLRECADAAGARRAIRGATALAVFAATIHPYLAAMCWVLFVACCARLWRLELIARAAAIRAVLAATAGIVAVFGAIGYFTVAPATIQGFNQFSADVLTLVNPMHLSHLMLGLPGVTLEPGQGEGIGFIGMGGMLALVAALTIYIRRRPTMPPGFGIIVGACVVMAVFAFSAVVTIGGWRLMTLRTFYDQFSAITGPFRSSGRFIWALHYLTLLFGIWGATRISRSGRQALGSAFLALAVLIQAADLRIPEYWTAARPLPRVPVDAFAVAAGKYRHLALVPMQVIAVCDDDYDMQYVNSYMLQAYRLGTTFNSGYFARVPFERTEEACANVERTVEAGRFDPHTIYVIRRTQAARFKALGATCGGFDGEWLCVSQDSDERFRRYLETGK